MSTPTAPERAGDPPPETRRLMSAAGVVASLFFLLVWLGPITYVGSAGRDLYKVGPIPVHRDLRHMHRVACLFTREVGAWGTYHIEIRPDAGADWVELPLDGFFDMSIFGYRTRFHRLFGKSYRRGGGAKRAQYMARWIADRYATMHPAAPPLHGVRYVSASRTVPELLKEEGRFRKLPLDQISPRRKRVLMTFEGTDMRYVPRKGSRASQRKRARPKLQPLPRPPAAPTRAGETPRLRPLPTTGQPTEPKSKRPLEALPRPVRPAPAAPAEGQGGER